jgi:four helix bundle protein
MQKFVQHFWELDVYILAFAFQQEIFLRTKSWPNDEKYALTDQVRRSSRAVGAAISEAWAKRKYPAHLVSKLTDSDGELQESKHWIKSAHACGYLTEELFQQLWIQTEHIGKKLGSMIQKPEKFSW